jgi:hypothetical protein
MTTSSTAVIMQIPEKFSQWYSDVVKVIRVKYSAFSYGLRVKYSKIWQNMVKYVRHFYVMIVTVTFEQHYDDATATDHGDHDHVVATTTTNFGLCFLSASFQNRELSNSLHAVGTFDWH